MTSVIAWTKSRWFWHLAWKWSSQTLWSNWWQHLSFLIAVWRKLGELISHVTTRLSYAQIIFSFRYWRLRSFEWAPIYSVSICFSILKGHSSKTLSLTNYTQTIRYWYCRWLQFNFSGTNLFELQLLQ